MLALSPQVSMTQTSSLNSGSAAAADETKTTHEEQVLPVEPDSPLEQSDSTGPIPMKRHATIQEPILIHKHVSRPRSSSLYGTSSSCSPPGIMILRRRSVSRHGRSLSANSLGTLDSVDGVPSASSQSSLGSRKKMVSEKILPHYRPIHVQAHTSLLSRDSSREGGSQLSFTGFRNLGMIVLVVGNLRLVVENYIKYGFIRSVYQMGFSKHDLQVAGLLSASIPLHLFFSLLVERFAVSVLIKAEQKHQPHASSQQKHLWTLFAALHSINAVLALSITSVAVYTQIFNPLIGTLCECHAIILALKVVSYALTNRDLRDAYFTGVSSSDPASSSSSATSTLPPIPDIYKRKPYPTNLTINNLIYFWWAPTLVYQPAYPLTPGIRPMYLIRHTVELIGTLMAMWFLMGQFAMPILENSLVHLHDWNLVTLGERLLKLATVSIVIWLLGFFAVFQSGLNILAELTCFADRGFYQDWWNSGSVGTYWKLWNKPVSNYFVRHLYIPMLKRGFTPSTSSGTVFFVSAVLHEVLVGIPTHNVIGVAFLSMILQIPLIGVTAPLERMRGPGTNLGNCVFWLSFFLGQPIGVMLYYLAWNLKYADHGLGQ